MDNIAQNQLEELQAVAKATSNLGPEIDAAGETILSALKAGQQILSCGNGGSATDAAHLAEELSGRYKAERKALPGLSLTADSAALTCIANDYGFEEIFARQVEAFGKAGDVLVGFSTSGNSENVYRAMVRAKAREMRTIALLGKDGGRMKELKLDHIIIIPSHTTARIQELHTLILHSWLEMVERCYAAR